MKDKMKLLVAYDGSECADGIFDDLRLAGLPGSVEALVISVNEEWLPVPHSYGMAERSLSSDSKAAVEVESLAKQGAERLRSLFPKWTVNRELFSGSPASAILVRADEWRPDLIVVGSHGRSTLGRLFLGSVSQRVVTEASGSVRISRGRADRDNSPIRIVIGIDGSPGSEAAVNEVVSRRWRPGTEVRVISAYQILMPGTFGYTIPPVVHAVDESNEEYHAEVRKAVDAAAGKLRAAGLSASGVVREGEPKRAIVEEAQHWAADSIFVGARGTSRFERLVLGSVSAGVAARAHCSVEVVRFKARA
jgi:nucleotide-binding universal stress UspA family protein